jgi:hypothetical protein
VKSKPGNEFAYVAYGISFCSNLPIAGLTPAHGTSSSLELDLASSPVRNCSITEKNLRYASDYLDEAGQPALKIWSVDDGEFLQMVYTDGTEFWLDRGLETMWVEWSETSSLENALGYLLGPALGVLLRLRGNVALHGSAVAIGDTAVIFVGAPGAGKSTTAAAFARGGFAILADDIAALVERDGVFHVLPAYPRVNLWPSSVSLLYGSQDALPLIGGEWDKRCLRLGEDGETRFEERTLPIGAIYLLEPGGAVDHETIETISKKTAMMSLVANTYGTNVLDTHQRAEEFAVLSRLVEAAPVRKIYPRCNALPLAGLCELICDDVAQIRSSSL